MHHNMIRQRNECSKCGKPCEVEDDIVGGRVGNVGGSATPSTAYPKERLEEMREVIDRVGKTPSGGGNYSPYAKPPNFYVRVERGHDLQILLEGAGRAVQNEALRVYECIKDFPATPELLREWAADDYPVEDCKISGFAMCLAAALEKEAP